LKTASERDAPSEGNSRIRSKCLGAVALAGTGLLATSGTAHAGFVGSYDLSNWTLTNTNADGFLTVLVPQTSIQLTGGDNQSFANGFTDFTITAVASGNVTFNWGYTSNDTGNYDQGGFLLNGVFTNLGENDNQTPFFDGSFTSPVSAGDVFGFRVFTVDNIFGPGNFGVTNFSAPDVVPEPGSLVLLALGAVGGALLFRRRSQAAEEALVN
jgi:hypothetical protein